MKARNLQEQLTHKKFIFLFNVIQSLNGMKRHELGTEMGYSKRTVDAWFSDRTPPERVLLLLERMIPENPKGFIQGVLNAMTVDGESNG